MKKFSGIIIRIFIVLAVMAALLLVFLRVAFPPAKIRAMIEHYASSELNREINFDDISFGIIGVSLKNFSLSEPGGFVNGTFAETKRLSFKVRFLPLLKKDIFISHVKADGLFVDIIKKEGKFNFQKTSDGVSAAGKSPENIKRNHIRFAVSDAVIKNSQIQYFDRDGNGIYIISGLSCDIRNLQINKPFTIKTKFDFSFKNTDREIKMPFEAFLSVDLKNMNIFQALVDAKYIKLRLHDSQVSARAKLSNFINPRVSISAESDIFTQDTLKDIHIIRPFRFDGFKVDADFDINFTEKKLVFDKLDISSGKSSISSSGNVYYEKEKEGFRFKSYMSLDFEEVLKGFRAHSGKVSFGGLFNAETEIDKNGIKAQARGENLSLTLHKAGVTISDFKGKSDFEIDFFSGEIIFSKLDFFIRNSIIASSGGVFEIKKKQYYFPSNAMIDVKDAAFIFDRYVNKYSPEGYADIVFTVSNAGVQGNAELKNAKAQYLPALYFDNLNAGIDFDSYYKIKISTMTGTLNGEKFILSAFYWKDLQNITFSANADIGRLYIPELPGHDEIEDFMSDGGDNDSPLETTVNDIPRNFNFKVRLHSDSVELPHIRSKTFDINADLKDVTAQQDRISGFITFNADKVLIENLDALINKNKYTKAAFYGLGMTYKITKEIGVNVFEEDEEAAHNSAVGLKFSSVEGNADFVPGVAHVRKLKFSSSYSSVNASGEIDLRDSELNMRVIISPLLAKSFVIKLTGNIHKPKVSVDLLGSAFTIIDTLQQAGTNIYDSVKHKKEEKKDQMK
ncbi:MAG: AsmA family protein [Endomicrobia bacterium]|nr:AsmA family protein [Endomicrobiia bacterium]